MAKAKSPQAPEPEFLPGLRAESAKLAQTISEATERKAQIDAVIASYGPTALPNLPQTPRSQKRLLHGRKKNRAVAPDRGEKATQGPYKGMALPEAAAKYLEAAREPQTGKEIGSALASAGFVILSQTPESAVVRGLRKRSQHTGDVIAVGQGKWGHVKNYTEDQVRQIREKNAAHLERTMAGIEIRTNDGVTWGRPQKIGPENVAKVRGLLASGVKAKDAARQAGMSIAYYYLHRDAIHAWKPGDPWQPWPGASGDPQRKLRVVK